MKSANEVEQMEFGLTGPEFPGANETIAGFIKIGDAGFTEGYLQKSLESAAGRKLFDAFTLAFFDHQRIPESENEIIQKACAESTA